MLLSVLLWVTMVAAMNCATTAPIIGILAQENYPINTTHQSYIAASYVKAVESAGARVVPIAINQTAEYYNDILGKINGVVFPGGGVVFTDPSGYGEAGRHIYNIAKKMNMKGDYFPILGVCLGYELMMFLSAGSYDVLTDCQSHSPLPLNFVRGYKSSKLYKEAPQQIINILRKFPVTANYHRKCVTYETLKRNNLSTKWSVLSTSKDENGLEFISSSESVRFPFAGIQFHPEKNAYEWKPTQKNPHSLRAIYAARYFNDWIVNEARKNGHRFKSEKEENEALIYNYNVTYSGKNNGTYEQVYYFKV